jgi:hypothetical protein
MQWLSGMFPLPCLSGVGQIVAMLHATAMGVGTGGAGKQRVNASLHWVTLVWKKRTPFCHDPRVVRIYPLPK